MDETERTFNLEINNREGFLEGHAKEDLRMSMSYPEKSGEVCLRQREQHEARESRECSGTERSSVG